MSTDTSAGLVLSQKRSSMGCAPNISSTVRDGRDVAWLTSSSVRSGGVFVCCSILYVYPSGTTHGVILIFRFWIICFSLFVFFVVYQACYWDIVLIGTKLLLRYRPDMRCSSLGNRPDVSFSWRSHSLSSLYKLLIDLVRRLLVPMQVVPLLIRHNNHSNLMMAQPY